MFALSESDLSSNLLGCGDGPASFNRELTRRGGRVTSVDPLYRFSADQIQTRIEATRREILEQTRKHYQHFVWTRITSVEQLEQIRMAAMTDFLHDYEPGRQAGRYLPAMLPSLPFKDQQFDLALCSHLLFLYSRQLSLAFHLQALREMLSVAREVRIFPLLDLGGGVSHHLEHVVATLRRENVQARIESVSYEFQRGGDRMLRLCPMAA
jgi:hypothetical protein